MLQERTYFFQRRWDELPSMTHQTSGRWPEWESISDTYKIGSMILQRHWSYSSCCWESYMCSRCKRGWLRIIFMHLFCYWTKQKLCSWLTKTCFAHNKMIMMARDCLFMHIGIATTDNYLVFTRNLLWPKPSFRRWPHTCRVEQYLPPIDIMHRYIILWSII